MLKICLSRSLRRIAISVALILTPPAFAQELKIMAVVNDEIVSEFDVDQRLRVLLQSTRLPPTKENIDKAVPQLLRQLVDERIQIQTAKKEQIVIDEKEIEDYFSNIAKSNGLTNEQFEQVLAQSGVEPKTIKNQFRAQITWRSLVIRKLSRQVNIGEAEIDRVLRELEANRNLPRLAVAEIVLAVDNPDIEQEVLGRAQEIVQQVRAGAEFGALARQYSDANSARNEGERGWMVRGQLPPQVDLALNNMSPGQISEPIRTASGFMIVKLKDKRAGGIQPEDARVVFKRLVMPYPQEVGEAAAPALMEKARQLRTTVKNCEEFNSLAVHGGPGTGTEGPQPIGDIISPFQQALLPLQVNDITQPIKFRDGVHLLMMCQRVEPQDVVPTRDEVREQLRQERLSLLSRRYLRELRREAYIDMRG